MLALKATGFHFPEDGADQTSEAEQAGRRLEQGRQLLLANGPQSIEARCWHQTVAALERGPEGRLGADGFRPGAASHHNGQQFP